MVDITATNFSKVPPTLNGNHKKGIRITFESLETAEKTVLETDDLGLYFTNRLAHGDYRVAAIKWVPSPSTNSVVQMSLGSDSGGWTIRIGENQVNNLGVFQWRSDDIDHRQDAQRPNGGYDLVDAAVARYDSDKKWGVFSRTNVSWALKRPTTADEILDGR